MARYFVVAMLCVFFSFPALAQPPEEPDIMSLYLISQKVQGIERNVFSRHDYTVIGILQDLLNIADQVNLQQVIQRFGGDSGFPPKFVQGNVAQLRSDLNYLLNGFPQGMDVFSNPLAVGEKTFIDQFGNFFTTDEPELFTPLPVTNTYHLTLYAGKNTAAASLVAALENVELVARENEYHIFVRDDVNTQQPATQVPTLTHLGMLFLAVALAAVALKMRGKREA